MKRGLHDKLNDGLREVRDRLNGVMGLLGNELEGDIKGTPWWTPRELVDTALIGGFGSSEWRTAAARFVNSTAPSSHETEERLALLHLYAMGGMKDDEFLRRYNAISKPAPTRFRHGDRVRVKDVDPIRFRFGEMGTIVEAGDGTSYTTAVDMDGTHHRLLFIDSQLELVPPKPAPAQPGEWRDWPDGPGWWLVDIMHTPAIRSYEYWTPMLLITVNRESAVTKNLEDGSKTIISLAEICHRHWLRLPDLPPKP